jgi:hypothetical protein
MLPTITRLYHISIGDYTRLPQTRVARIPHEGKGVAFSPLCV